ncbi:tyrosine-type recombinase/integrase [Magnetovibrio blakemorei]|uniref:Tyr recombinase domain-containing protein n=1 Tax=Magnetovibrio blakemorei TaxID=28181 RepID=A0A1E5Q304_9PROT|nr:site-specific integrase [Magnetovibrio blakemorei]OEJ63871.1 hypothetical protein BEN30_17105 [Magnetovibrio blakemorei]
MMNENKKIRHFVSKKQKSGHVLYYWQPTNMLRKNGFLPRRLNDDLETAKLEAKTLNRELDTWRNGGAEPIEKILQKGSLLSDVIDTYYKDPVFTSKAHATQRIYTQCLDRIDSWAGDQPINTISRGNIINFHRTLYAKKPAFANAIGRQMRILFEFAYDRGIIDSNPARRIKMPSRPPRDQVWSVDDQDKFIKAAEDMAYPSMGLAVLLAVSTAQRQGDILKLCWSQFDQAANEIRLKQGKTGKWVAVPILPELRSALEKASVKNEFIVSSEATDKAYRPDHFRHLFKKITNAADIEGLQFRDLRRTAIVRMGEAGISTTCITAVSGHDIGHCERILETYMPRNSDMAREAISAYQLYRQRKSRKSK